MKCKHNWVEATDMPMVYCSKCFYPHQTVCFLDELTDKEENDILSTVMERTGDD